MPGYRRQPRGWQAQRAELVRATLGNLPPAGQGILDLAQPSEPPTYTTPKWGVVQIFYAIWRLHVQCEFDHNQEPIEGLAANGFRIRISLDFEETDREWLTKAQVASLRRMIKGRIPQRAISKLGANIQVVRRDDWHHLIQEWMRISDPLQDIRAVADRMVQYVVALMPVATTAVEEWLEAN